MNFFTNLIRLGVVYGMASIIGFWVMLMTSFTILKKGPRWFFRRKTRESRPECMQDSRLGSHGFLRTQDVRLHYVAAGSCSNPLMLMLHGFPECWYAWRYQLREFKEDYRVVAIDMRGYGESDVLPDVKDFQMKKLVEDVKEAIAALGYSSCVLVAHDWGGAVAWTFATEYPDLVDKLICMNIPHPIRLWEHLHSSFKQMTKSWYMLLFQLPYLPELIISAGDFSIFKTFQGPKAVKKKENMTADDMEAFKFAISQPGCLTAALNYYRAALRYPAKSRHAPMIPSPTLLIWGDADMAFDNQVLEGHDRFVKDFTLKKIAGACHWVQQDEPETVNKFMREFLGGGKSDCC